MARFTGSVLSAIPRASPAGPRSSLVKASLGYRRWRPDSHLPDFENRLPFSTLFRPRCGLSHYYLRVLPGKEGKNSRADPNKLERKKKKPRGCPRRQEGDLLILYFFRSNCARSLARLPPSPLPPLQISLINSAPIWGSNTDTGLNVTRPGVAVQPASN